jgi:serine/threonine protein kinase
MNIAVLIKETHPQCTYLPLVMDRPISNAKYSIFHLQTFHKDFECALKIFPKDKISQFSFYREKKILSMINQDNIVKYIPNIKFNNQAYDCNFLPMEYAPYGDFFDLIFSQELSNENLIRTYFQQLVEGIGHLHSKGIAHLDVKLENLLLGQDYVLKITDFDQSQALNETSLLYKGSPSFRAPEVINGTCKDFCAADMYSIGIVLFIFATGEFPFLEKEDQYGCTLAHYDLFCENNEKFWELRIGKRADKSLFSEALKELITGLLKKDPKERYTINDVEASRWYKGETLNKEELKLVMDKVLNKGVQESAEHIKGKEDMKETSP